jgi:formylglycine-generating enzyme required for sulfatase activity
MKKRFLLSLALWLMAGLGLVPQGRLMGQHPAATEGAVKNVPAELAWITLFSDRVQMNPQGCWEIELLDGIEMIYVPAGEFMMGSPRQEDGWESGEDPVHRVYTKGIWIGKFEVTRATWQAVMGGGAVPYEERNLPKVQVSFYEAQKFLRALQMKSGLHFRLPSEAEWEKCCRGGSPAPHYGLLNEIAWHVVNSGERLHAVGRKKPNAFGVFDMLGNVWELCSDWYGSTYYDESPYLNPAGPRQGKRRVCRGGGFRHGGHYLRCAHRNDQDPAKGKPHLGFRLVLDSQL